MSLSGSRSWGEGEEEVRWRSSNGDRDDEEELRWAALERLPTYERLRTSIFRSVVEEERGGKRGVEVREVDVRRLGSGERQEFIERLFREPEEDNEKFLAKLRNRIDRVGIQLPTVEVRFDNLTIEVECQVGSRALPTLWNATRNLAESAAAMIGIHLSKATTLTILKDASGIIRPSRMSLLLGPPSSGKTTLLLALAGKLDPYLKMMGEATYNGYKIEEFVARKTSTYVSQHDVHIGEMTVKETLDFSARYQGLGSRHELLSELAKREKEEGVFPEADVDLFMKSTAMEGLKSTLLTDYILKILGLEICKDTTVGDALQRGISGGEKKRVTIGEMIVGPSRTLFMDEISTGLDSSTTFQIVKCLQQIAHLMDATIFMSLLQPAPETFELFDDVILLSEGQIVYQGPRVHVVEFFESCDFKCPERKGVADFLQEVTSMKDQKQYWEDKTKPYHYVSVQEFVERFRTFHVGISLVNELSAPLVQKKSHRAALIFTRDVVPKWELLKTSFAKEWLLMKRNSFVYIFKIIMTMIMASIGSSLFVRTKMHTETEDDGGHYFQALIYAVAVNMFNELAETNMMIVKLPVLFKQRDLLFYPAWVFALPNIVLKLPISIFESAVWMAMTYYPMGFAPEASRFFKQFLVVFWIQQMALSLFRFTAGCCRTITISGTGGSLALLLVLLLGGFVIPRGEIPKWWTWGYWSSPLSYAINAITANEFFAPRWMNKKAADGRRSLGIVVLDYVGVFAVEYWYWIGVSALVGFTILFNILFTVALTYLDLPGKPQAVISEDAVAEREVNHENEMNSSDTNSTQRQNLFEGNGNGVTEMGRISSPSNGFHRNSDSVSEVAKRLAPQRGMVLPFTPLTMSFDDVNYYVDMPQEKKDQGVTDNRLQLLRGVTGAFRPGILTALMGVSGTGKTTLMDVLAGRKTGGYIEGDISISGYPKVQETFARISGYCEQTDIHSPQVTVRESLIYSAFLRLPPEVSHQEKMAFVDEVMELVELENLKDALVGLPGISGLSTEQRKRLTIAVELVANPSIIFMDEPTTGLDARAAAIVMRAVRNTVDTGRTVLCTIHQPSIDIFEAFDELVLMKRGGQVIYSGPLGTNSQKVIEYFQAIPGIEKIKDRYNPATWMLEVSSASAEARLSIDFAELYQSSSLYMKNKELIEELSTPPMESSDLHFRTQYSQSGFNQFKSCLWKQWLTYWRSPTYNLVRFFFALAAALLMGTIFWKMGAKRDTSTDLTIIVGAMYAALVFVAINNSMDANTYALAQVIVEIPYVLFQTTYYAVILYGMMSFEWEAAKFFWFFFITFFNFLYFTYFGMMTVSMAPNHEVAAILASSFYALFSVFSGFYIPKPRIPKWWIWYYWICPTAWTMYGLIVSQYGNLEDEINVPGGGRQRIKDYVKDHFGYSRDLMGPVAGVLVGFAAFFAFIFGFCIKKLNFQHR